MPKLIKCYDVAEFKSVNKISDVPYELWQWRELYIGYQGELLIFKSEKKHPGKHFMHFTDRHSYITTGCGEYTIEESTITMTTQNSIYEFVILHAGGENECNENF